MTAYDAVTAARASAWCYRWLCVDRRTGRTPADYDMDVWNPVLDEDEPLIGWWRWIGRLNGHTFGEQQHWVDQFTCGAEPDVPADPRDLDAATRRAVADLAPLVLADYPEPTDDDLSAATERLLADGFVPTLRADAP